MSRRSVLLLGAIGTTSAAIGGIGLARSGWPPLAAGGGRGTAAGPTGLTEPPMLHAQGGLLEVDLDAAWSTQDIAGRPVAVMTYAGTLPGPTLALAPGDLLRVRLRNGLDAPTNLHVHGLHVPATGAGDDPFVRVEPGGVHLYEYRIPDDHPEGLFWYHPHHHGLVADQVSAGLYGAILVSSTTPGAHDRVLVVSDITIARTGRVAGASRMDRVVGREGAEVLVNGQSEPVLDLPAGTRQRWHILNACASRYLDLQVPGMRWTTVAHDGHPDPEPTESTGLGLAPGGRVEVLLTVPPGTSTLQTRYVDRGAAMHGAVADSADAAVPIATLVGTTAALQPTTVPGKPVPRPALRDLRAERAVRGRHIRLGGGMGPAMGPMAFTIDGRSFDPDRSDIDVAVGSVEEWTFENATWMRHPMHLHVWPMQVVARNARPVAGVQWRDVVDVPAGGSTTVRIAFDDFPGRTVVHCHVLDHEDLGMMSVVTASSRQSGAAR